MRFTITSSLLAPAGIASAVLSLSLALLGMPLLAVLPAALSLLFNSRWSGRSKALELSDLHVFVGNLIANYSPGRSTMSIIRSSLDPGLVFYNKVTDALHMYELSGNAQRAFAWADCCSSRLCKEVFFALSESLESGTIMLGPIKELYRNISSAQAIQLRSVGSATNALSIVSVGSVVFFPIFAGISYYIMGFSSGLSGNAAIGFAAYAFMIVFYVSEISVYNSLHGALDRGAISGILANIAVGTLLFRLSYMFALSGIRW
ncbi:MAG: hypothetical protein ACP5UH_01765 [Candidatus Micrarchaeia archaeon]